ncbi:MAG: hypothetical protein AAB074_03900 [Planctomycetota bacterium]
MTTMNKIRAWSFAAFVGALALADWQVPSLVADGEEFAMPKAEVNGVKVTAEVKDVAVGDKVEKHWVVTLGGDGKGEMTISCTSMPWEPFSRMMPSPKLVWTKTLSFDTSVSRTIDLGIAPEAEAKASFTLALGKIGNDLEDAFATVRLAHIEALKPKGEVIIAEDVVEEGTVRIESSEAVTK